MIPSILTFIGTIIACVAVLLVPGKRSIEEEDHPKYDSWGKGAIYFLSFVIIGLAGYIFYSWYIGNERDVWTTLNLVLFMAIGIGMLAGNARIAKKVKELEMEEAIEVVVEVLEPEIIYERPKKKKKAKRKAPVKKKIKKKTPVKKKIRKTAVKKTKKKKVKVKKKAATFDEELIQDDEPVTAKGTSCPSCDTPHDGTDDNCPVCGEDL